MRNRILIAPNSFKECADSVTIAELIRNNLIHLKNAELIVKPISDGGDGFLNVCKYYFGGEIVKFKISSAYDDSNFECPILYLESKQEVYIESADILGLKVVPLSGRNPTKLSSKGLGELLIKIEEWIRQNSLKIEKVYIGIGGTATIDMGLGMMAKLGLKFYNASDMEIDVIPENFLLKERFEYKPVKLSFKINPIVDVTNPLFGTEGGIRTFGEQKGASQESILILERSFKQLINLFNSNGLKILPDKLSGAGGGIAAAFQIFYKSDLIPSYEFINHYLDLKKYKNMVDYVITGEGAYDTQSDSGKGVKTIVELFKSNAQQIILVCGKIIGINFKNMPQNIILIELRKYFMDDYSSVKNFRSGIEKACKEIIGKLNF